MKSLIDNSLKAQINNNSSKSELSNQERLTQESSFHTDKTKIQSDVVLPDPLAKPFFIMTLEFEKGKYKTIKIFPDSDATEWAFNFCKENELDFTALKYLTAEITKLWEKFNDSRNKYNGKNIGNDISNNSIQEVEEENILTDKTQDQKLSGRIGTDDMNMNSNRNPSNNIGNNFGFIYSSIDSKDEDDCNYNNNNEVIPEDNTGKEDWGQRNQVFVRNENDSEEEEEGGDEKQYEEYGNEDVNNNDNNEDDDDGDDDDEEAIERKKNEEENEIIHQLQKQNQCRVDNTPQDFQRKIWVDIIPNEVGCETEWKESNRSNSNSNSNNTRRESIAFGRDVMPMEETKPKGEQLINPNVNWNHNKQDAILTLLNKKIAEEKEKITNVINSNTIPQLKIQSDKTKISNRFIVDPGSNAGEEIDVQYNNVNTLNKTVINTKTISSSTAWNGQNEKELKETSNQTNDIYINNNGRVFDRNEDKKYYLFTAEDQVRQVDKKEELHRSWNNSNGWKEYPKTNFEYNSIDIQKILELQRRKNEINNLWEYENSCSSNENENEHEHEHEDVSVSNEWENQEQYHVSREDEENYDMKKILEEEDEKERKEYLEYEKNQMKISENTPKMLTGFQPAVLEDKKDWSLRDNKDVKNRTMIKQNTNLIWNEVDYNYPDEVEISNSTKVKQAKEDHKSLYSNDKKSASLQVQSKEIEIWNTNPNPKQPKLELIQIKETEVEISIPNKMLKQEHTNTQTQISSNTASNIPQTGTKKIKTTTTTTISKQLVSSASQNMKNTTNLKEKQRLFQYELLTENDIFVNNNTNNAKEMKQDKIQIDNEPDNKRANSQKSHRFLKEIIPRSSSVNIFEKWYSDAEWNRQLPKRPCHFNHRINNMNDLIESNSNINININYSNCNTNNSQYQYHTEYNIPKISYSKGLKKHNVKDGKNYGEYWYTEDQKGKIKKTEKIRTIKANLNKELKETTRVKCSDEASGDKTRSKSTKNKAVNIQISILKSERKAQASTKNKSTEKRSQSCLKNSSMMNKSNHNTSADKPAITEANIKDNANANPNANTSNDTNEIGNRSISKGNSLNTDKNKTQKIILLTKKNLLNNILKEKLNKIKTDLDTKYTFHPKINENYQFESGLSFLKRQEIYTSNTTVISSQGNQRSHKHSNNYSTTSANITNLWKYPMQNHNEISNNEQSWSSSKSKPKANANKKKKNINIFNRNSIKNYNSYDQQVSVTHSNNMNNLRWNGAASTHQKHKDKPISLYKAPRKSDANIISNNSNGSNHLFYTKTTRVPSAQNTNEMNDIFHQNKSELFLKLFSIWDSDQDDIISYATYSTKNMPQKILDIISPMLIQMKQNYAKITKLEFLENMDKLYSHLKIDDKQELINFFNIKRNKRSNSAAVSNTATKEVNKSVLNRTKILAEVFKKKIMQSFSMGDVNNQKCNNNNNNNNDYCSRTQKFGHSVNDSLIKPPKCNTVRLIPHKLVTNVSISDNDLTPNRNNKLIIISLPFLTNNYLNLIKIMPLSTKELNIETDFFETIPKSVGAYQIKTLLHAGKNSNVYLGVSVYTGDKIAIKIIDKNQLRGNINEIPYIMNQISVLKFAKHKNIVTLYEIFESSNFIYLITELIEDTPLVERIINQTKLPEKEALTIFQQVMDAMMYLNKCAICHRNIKTESILFNKHQMPKIISFGYSTFYNKKFNQKLKDEAGSPSFQCPEMYWNNAYSPEWADVWSWGVLWYVMTCGCLPFAEDDYETNKELITNGTISYPDFLSNDWKDLLNGMLCVKPELRYNFDKIIRHNWVKTRFSPIGGINIYESNYPCDERLLNIISEYGFNKDTVRKDLDKNKFNPGTSVYKQWMIKVKDQGMISNSDLYSTDYLSAVNNNKKKKNTSIQRTFDEYLKREIQINTENQKLEKMYLDKVKVAIQEWFDLKEKWLKTPEVETVSVQGEEMKQEENVNNDNDNNNKAMILDDQGWIKTMNDGKDISTELQKGESGSKKTIDKNENEMQIETSNQWWSIEQADVPNVKWEEKHDKMLNSASVSSSSSNNNNKLKHNIAVEIPLPIKNKYQPQLIPVETVIPIKYQCHDIEEQYEKEVTRQENIKINKSKFVILEKRYTEINNQTTNLNPKQHHQHQNHKTCPSPETSPGTLTPSCTTTTNNNRRNIIDAPTGYPERSKNNFTKRNTKTVGVKTRTQVPIITTISPSRFLKTNKDNSKSPNWNKQTNPDLERLRSITPCKANVPIPISLFKIQQETNVHQSKNKQSRNKKRRNLWKFLQTSEDPDTWSNNKQNSGIKKDRSCNSNLFIITSPNTPHYFDEEQTNLNLKNGKSFECDRSVGIPIVRTSPLITCTTNNNTPLGTRAYISKEKQIANHIFTKLTSNATTMGNQPGSGSKMNQHFKNRSLIITPENPRVTGDNWVNNNQSTFVEFLEKYAHAVANSNNMPSKYLNGYYKNLNKSTNSSKRFTGRNNIRTVPIKLEKAPQGSTRQRFSQKEISNKPSEITQWSNENILPDFTTNNTNNVNSTCIFDISHSNDKTQPNKRKKYFNRFTRRLPTHDNNNTPVVMRNRQHIQPNESNKTINPKRFTGPVDIKCISTKTPNESIKYLINQLNKAQVQFVEDEQYKASNNYFSVEVKLIENEFAYYDIKCRNLDDESERNPMITRELIKSILE